MPVQPQNYQNKILQNIATAKSERKQHRAKAHSSLIFIKMPIELTPDFVKSAISTRHPNASICESLAIKLEVHARGITPTILINERRPNESEETKNYRKKIEYYLF